MSKNWPTEKQPDKQKNLVNQRTKFNQRTQPKEKQTNNHQDTSFPTKLQKQLKTTGVNEHVTTTDKSALP